MKAILRRVLFLSTLVTGAALHADRGIQPQYAPPEAYLPGEKLPYFGSENPWDRRFFEEAAPRSGRLGQTVVLDLVEGRVDQAIAKARHQLEKDAGDLEAHFTLALALAGKNQLEEAERELSTALDLGLPVTRVLAGPRPLLEPLTRTETYAQRVRGRTHGLVHGPLLGAVTPASARIWVRTEKEASVQVRVSRRGDFARPDAQATARSRAGDDYTAVVEVAGLAPSTHYRYAVLIDGQPVPRWPEWEFTTFQKDDDRSTVRIAFGGCAMYAPENERMWDVIRLRQPQAFLILGDNVYIDLPEQTGPFHDYSYYCRQSRPEFRRLAASTPIYAIWDDHDVGTDDIFLGPYVDKPAWKPSIFRTFRQNWNNPFYGAEPKTPGVWFNFRMGPVEFFLLDGRYYRENWLRPGASMLGPVQKAWLNEALVKSTARFKVIVSGTPWADDAKLETDPATGKEIEANDGWSGFRAERDEIYDLLAAHKLEGVLLLSGDRHRADLRLNPRPHGYPLYELECSRLTNPVGAGFSGKTLWEYDKGCTFALLTFEATAAEPGLTMEVSTIEGERIFERKVPLREMREP